MVLELPYDRIHRYRAFMFAFQMEPGRDRVDTVEFALTAPGFLRVQLIRQSRKIKPGGRLSGNHLHPGLIPVLKLGVLPLDQQDPCASGRVVDGQRMARAPL